MKTWLGKFKSITLLGLLTIVLAGCGKENLTALSPKGGSADTSLYLIILTTIVMSLVLLEVVIPFIIELFQFGKKKGDVEAIAQQAERDEKVERNWTNIVIILEVIMAVTTVHATCEHADDEDAAEHENIDFADNQYWLHSDFAD